MSGDHQVAEHHHAHIHEHGEPEHHNANAGQGAVLLDIGGDIGALILTMSDAQLEGSEIEIRPVPRLSIEPLRHVGVVSRPTPSGRVHSAVFDGLDEGRYELYVRPDGPVQLEVEVRGGEVSFAEWPS